MILANSILFFFLKGSFLDRSKTTLSRLSSLTSNRSKTNAPTRSFVYQSKSSNSTPEGPDASKVGYIYLGSDEAEIAINFRYVVRRHSLLQIAGVDSGKVTK